MASPGGHLFTERGKKGPKIPSNPKWTAKDVMESCKLDDFDVVACDNPQQVKEGSLTLYGGQLMRGMLFPFPPFVTRFLNFVNVCPQQIGGISWLVIASVCELEARYGLTVDPTWLLTKFDVKKCDSGHWGLPVMYLTHSRSSHGNPAFGNFPDSNNLWPNSPFNITPKEGSRPIAAGDVKFPLKWGPLHHVNYKGKYHAEHWVAKAKEFDCQILKATKITSNIWWKHLLPRKWGGRPDLPLAPMGDVQLLRKRDRDKKKRLLEAANSSEPSEKLRTKEEDVEEEEEIDGDEHKATIFSYADGFEFVRRDIKVLEMEPIITDEGSPRPAPAPTSMKMDAASSTNESRAASSGEACLEMSDGDNSNVPTVDDIDDELTRYMKATNKAKIVSSAGREERDIYIRSIALASDDKPRLPKHTDVSKSFSSSNDSSSALSHPMHSELGLFSDRSGTDMDMEFGIFSASEDGGFGEADHLQRSFEMDSPAQIPLRQDASGSGTKPIKPPKLKVGSDHQRDVSWLVNMLDLTRQVAGGLVDKATAETARLRDDLEEKLAIADMELVRLKSVVEQHEVEIANLRQEVQNEKANGNQILKNSLIQIRKLKEDVARYKESLKKKKAGNSTAPTS